MAQKGRVPMNPAHEKEDSQKGFQHLVMTQGFHGWGEEECNS
jgi:hypothetical protein